MIGAVFDDFGAGVAEAVAGFFVVLGVADTGMSRFCPVVVFAGLGAGVDLPGFAGAGFSS